MRPSLMIACPLRFNTRGHHSGATRRRSDGGGPAPWCVLGQCGSSHYWLSCTFHRRLMLACPLHLNTLGNHVAGTRRRSEPVVLETSSSYELPIVTIRTIGTSTHYYARAHRARATCRVHGERVFSPFLSTSFSTNSSSPASDGAPRSGCCWCWSK